MIDKMAAQQMILKAIEQTKVATWKGFSISAWTKGDKVRVYINHNRVSQGYVEITDDGAKMVDMPGASMTRNIVNDTLRTLVLPTTAAPVATPIVVTPVAPAQRDYVRESLAQEGEDVDGNEREDFAIGAAEGIGFGPKW